MYTFETYQPAEVTVPPPGLPGLPRVVLPVRAVVPRMLGDDLVCARARFLRCQVVNEALQRARQGRLLFTREYGERLDRRGQLWRLARRRRGDV